MSQPLLVAIQHPRVSTEDVEWLVEIATAELAISKLLAAKRVTLLRSPTHEQVLWTRHYDRLRAMKRQLDAVVM